MIKELDISQFTPTADKAIWDVRDNDSYNLGHIVYAVSRPIEQIEKSSLQDTPNEIYILCGGGTKAGRACALLQSIDETKTIIHLVGGTRKAKTLGWELEVEAKP